MDSYCSKRHTRCPFYGKQNELPFRSFKILKGEKQSNIKVKETTIIFLLKGEFLLSYNDLFEKRIQAGEMILFSALHMVDITVIEDVYGIFCMFNTQVQICENFFLESLVSPDEIDKNCHAPLTINKWVNDFLNVIDRYLEDTLWCTVLYEIKKNELFYLLKNTYATTELAIFFYPILNKDVLFKESVIKKYHQIRNITELASATGYSVSGFKKKFLKCFGMPAYTWMQQQRANVVLKELKEKKKTLKEVFISNHFSSQAHLHEFCKKNFGKTPGQIRNGEQTSVMYSMNSTTESLSKSK